MLTQKLNALLEKYNYSQRGEIREDRLIASNKDTMLLPWRNQRKIKEMRAVIQGDYFAGLSVIKANVLAEKTANLDGLIAREIDICEYLSGSDVCEVFALKNNKSVNVSLKLNSGVVVTIEINASVEKGDCTAKHEAIGKSGIVCDLAIDTQVCQDSIYLYTDKNQKFTDTDFELYGLSAEDAATVRQAFLIVIGEDKTNYNSVQKHLSKMLAAVKKSINETINIVI